MYNPASYSVLDRLPGTSDSKQIVLVIGGTGAQGMAVVKALVEDEKYTVNVLTRSETSSTAIELSKLPGVTIIPGDGYDEATLHSAFKNVNLAFINTNGFAIGEKAEIYWGIRMFEIAAENGIKHFVWANLDSSYKLSGWKPEFRTGHFDGKDKVADWISAQGNKLAMKWSILTSCMYLEMFSELLAPTPKVIDGETVFVFTAPLGNGTPPMIFLEDLGRYARWLFDNPHTATGMNLKIATQQVGWEDVAKSFTEITGKKAVYQDVSLENYFSLPIFPDPDAKVGHSVGHEDGTLQTYRQNFSGFWNTWKENILERDYTLLDEILPTRVKSVKEWMKLTGYTGQKESILKDYSDRK